VPFLRVIRDKRGYETTYLMHWYREGNRQRSRILYVFRTPGGVRVGREALDPDILREIERKYPDIDFDWQVVVENQQVVESAPEQRRPKKRRREEEGEAAPAPEKAATSESVASPAPAPRPAIPAAIEGATPDEQIAFLAQWYPVLRQRVEQRAQDPVRREALLALVERLNTTSWTDADQITSGLQHAAEALERLSSVFGKRRRRARRSKKPDRAAGATDIASPPDTPTPDA
jgi:hypothetical protein